MDFNNIKTSGIYTMISSTNSPTGGNFYGTLIVMNGGRSGYVAQLAIAVNGNAYSRGFDGGTTWSAWKVLNNA